MTSLTTFRRVVDTARTINPDGLIDPHERHAASITDVRIGGVIRYRGEVFVVRSTATYTELTEKTKKPKRGGYVVTELVLRSLKTGETRYIEWAVDDEIEISFTERKIQSGELGRQLQYDDGEAIDLDDDIDEIVEKGWEVVFNGTTYDYDDDWLTRYESSDGRTSLFCYMYEFGSDEVGWFTVEAWSSNGEEDGKWEYEVFLAHAVSLNEVEIISLGPTS